METKPKNLLVRIARKSAKLLVISALAFIVAFVIFLSRYADETGIGWYYRMLNPVTTLYFYPRHYLSLAGDLGRPQPCLMDENEIYWDKVMISFGGSCQNKSGKLKIERKNDKEAEFITIYNAGIPDGVFKDSNLTPQTEYVYRFTVCNRLRCSYPAIFTVTTYEEPPAPVTDLKTSVPSQTEIDLSWHYLGKGLKGFKVLKSTESGFIPVMTLPPDQMQFSDCHLSPGTIYTYKVEAFGAHFTSNNSPFVSAKTLELERIGTTSFENKVPEALIVRNGNGWVAVSSETVSPPKPNDGDAGNSEIFLQTFDSEFNPLGKKIQVSNNPCLSISPSVAWNGEEFGVVWLDSRDAKECISGGDYNPPLRIYFARVSNGKRIGSEVRVSGNMGYGFSGPPRLFWSKDHYDLFMPSGAIEYAKLDRTGKIMEAMITIADTLVVSTQGVDIIPAGDKYGLAWAGTKIHGHNVLPGHNILSFLEFTPGAENNPKPVSISETCSENIYRYSDYCYSGGYYQAPGGSIFWTGEKFGVCWQNYHGDVMVSMISSSLNKPAWTFKALRESEKSCGQASEPTPVLVYSNAAAPLCAWSGSGLGIVERVVVGPKIEYAFAQVNDSGQLIGKVKYLDIPYTYNEKLGPLGWEPPSFYAFYKKSMLVITP